MRSRFSRVDRLIARVLLWTLTATNVWTMTPVTAAAQHETGLVINQRSAAQYGGQSAQPPAVAATFYGPQRFTRTTGAPNVFTATVAVPSGVGAPFTLHVQNGEADGTRRISSAVIAVNNVNVAVESDFSQNVAVLDRRVTLNATNALKVTLRRTPGAYLTITITGGSVDRTAPRIALVSPAPASLTSSTTPTVIIGYQDLTAPGDPGAAGLDVSSLSVRIDGVDRTSLFSRGAEQATAQLPPADALTDAVHTVTASIADRIGNVGSTSAQFRVDTTVPTLQIIEPSAAAFVNTHTPTIRVRYEDLDGVDASTLQVLVNGQDRTPLFNKAAGEAVATLDGASALADGTAQVVASIRDAVGNTGSNASSFIVDTASPAVEIVEPGLNHYTAANAIDVAGTVADTSPVAVTVNGIAAIVAGASFRASGVPLGAGPEIDVQVVATDAAGNAGRTARTVHVDRANPSVRIAEPVPGSYLSAAAVVVSGSVSDASPVTVTVNGAAAAVDGSTFRATLAVPNGPFAIHVAAEDAAGNTGTADESMFIDSAAPLLAITAPGDGFVTNQAATHITGSVSDTAPVTVSVNGSMVPVTDGTFGFDAPLVTGANAITVTATDAAGNTASNTVHVTLDQAPPTIQIAAPGDNTYLGTPSPTIRVVYHDDGSIDASTLRVLVDGQDQTARFAAAAGVATAAIPLADGSHEVTSRVIDAAGNEATASARFNVDTASPTVGVGLPADGAFTNATTITVSGTVNDTSPVTVRVNGISAAVSGGGFSAPDVPLGDGSSATLEVAATDAAGNIGRATIRVRIDRAAPVIVVAQPAANAYVKGRTITVTGTADDTALASVTVNGVAATVDGASFSAAITADDGPLTLTVTGLDAAGNVGTATRAFSVDSVAPAMSVTAPAAGLVTNGGSVRVQGTASDTSPLTVTVAGADVPVANGAFSYEAPLAGEGATAIAIVATDAAGNVASQSVSVTVDRTAPAIQITAPMGGAFLEGPTIAVSGSVSDSASASVVVNGVAAAITDNTFTATVPASDGSFAVHATATDAAGNTASATTTVTIDSAAPVVTILEPAQGQYTAATALDVSGGVTDASDVRVSVNGVDAIVTGASFVASGVGIGDGPSTPIQVLATDAAGNTSTSTVTVRVDRTPPVVRITSPIAGAYRKGPVLRIEGTVTDLSPVLVEVNGELAAVSGSSFRADVPSSDGSFAAVATARDAAGNSSTATVSVVVDSVAPQISVSSPAESLVTNQSTIQIVGSVSDTAPVTLRLGDVLVPLSNNSFTQAAPLAPEGDRTLTLRATDAAGNESTFDVHVTLDQTPPDLSVMAPDTGATLGSTPIVAQGLVYDATATTVSVNGVPATRVQDAWQASVGGSSEGPQRLTIVATDAAGNTQTVTRDVTLDLAAPIVAFASPASGTLTKAQTIDVSGTASDITLTSVVVNGTAAILGPVSGTTRPFAATIPLVDGENHLIATATDAFARTAQSEVIVARDSTAPTISVSAADTISRLRGATATVTASDDVGLAQLTATLNGLPFGSFTSAPATLPLTVPAAASVGDTLTLTVTATDRAGNSSSASHALRVIADGVVIGQVLSDETGLPLAAATVTSIGTGADADPKAPPRIATSDARGGYSTPAADASVLVAVSRDGMTTVERQVPIQNGVGTAVVDARLTTIVPATTIGAEGGTLTAPRITVSIPGGALSAPAAVSLTPLSPQGLPALLPLGWSPLAAFDLRGAASFSGVLSVEVTGLPTLELPIPNPVLVMYRSSTHGWFVVAPPIAIGGSRASFTIAGAGSYALVVADDMDPAIPAPAVDQPLSGVDVVVLPPGATATGTVSPSTLPPGGGTAAGSLAIQSAASLPSGTIVQAQVTESYGLTTGAVASEEQRSQDIILYRVPATTSRDSQIPIPALSAFFPITPSRSYDTTTLVEGKVHLDILAGREAVRGQTGGSEPITVDAGGGVTLTVPAHALPGDTAVRVQPAILSTFVPGATANTAPPDVQPLGEVVVDFASQTLALAAELTVGFAGSVPLDPADSLLVARVIRVGGVPRMFVVARAELVGDRLVSRAVAGLPGVAVSGRYVFYRVGGITGLVAGTLSASGSPVNGLVESSSLPFVGLAGGDGRFVIATRAADVTLTGRVAGTSLQGTATVTVAAGQMAARDIVLAGAVTMAMVTPGDGATLVDVTTQIEVQTTAPLDANAVTSASLTLTTADTPPQSIAVRRVLSGSGQVLAIVPETKLAAATAYRFDAAGLLDVYGGAVSIAPITFTTKADAPSTYDTRKVIVSTPDDNGIAHVTAAPGTVPPGTQVLVVNAGSGSVARFTADNDGALNGEVSATVEDRLIVTITDPAGAVTTFERGAYIAPDQSKTAVNSAGGVVDEPGQAGFAAGAKLVIPPDALAASLFFSLTRVDIRAVFPDEPDPDVPMGHIGGSIKITASAGPLQKEAKISFDKPADAPDGAAYLVFRRLQGPNGTIAYEILDQALLDPATGKVTTASPPYAGFGMNLGGYTATGIGGGAIGGLVDQFETLMWMFDQALPKPLPGLITGTVRRAKFAPGATAPVYEPVPNAMVSGVAISGRPLYDERSGSTVAVSQPDGTFALFDPRYTGGQVTISAKAPEGEVVTSTAYEANAQEGRAGYLLRYYHNVAVANVTFAAKAPASGPTRVTVHAFTGSDASRVEISGPITAGTPVRIRVSAETTPADPTLPKPNVTSVSIQQTPYTVTPDEQAGDWVLPEAFVPPQAGTYVITAIAQPPIGSAVTGTFILRAVAPGGTTRDSLPNDPPAVITSLTFPKADATGVQPTVVPQVSFTEPVKNIADESTAHVTLIDSAGANVALNIQGAGLTGAVEHISDPNVIVTGLTLQPIAPLKYGTTYTLTLTSDIVDTDATPKHLVAYQTTFTTFQPARLVPTTAQTPTAADQFNGGGLAVVGNRAYLAQNNGPSTSVRLFDVTKPELPVEIAPQAQGNQLLSPPPISHRGHPADLAVEDDSPAIGQGRLLALGLTNLALPYHPSNLMFYDVTSDESWRWVGAVTLGSDPIDGMVRRIQLRGNRLYAATPGVGKGIQVVDVPTALSVFAAAGATGEGSPDFFELGRSLGLEGQGFGRQAIVQTIFVPSPSMGNMSNVWDLDVIDLTVDGTSQPIVVAAGRAGFTVANPQAQSDQLLFNGPVVDDNQAPVMDWGFNVAAGMVNGVPIAAVLAFTPVSQGGFGAGYVVVIADLTNPRVPKLLGTIALPSFPAGVRTDALLQGDRLFIGTDTQTFVVSLANPAQPQLLGAITGVAGRLAFSDKGLLFTNVVGFADTVSQAGGVRSATLGTTVLITRITPSELVNNPAGAATTARDVVAEFRVVPADYQISAATVELFRNGQLVDTIAATADGPSGQAIWPAGRTIDRDAIYTAHVTVDPASDRPLVSPQAPVPLVQIVFVDKRGEESFAPPMSDPRPRVVLDPIRQADVSLSADGTQADVRVSGVVTDSLADIVPDHAADIRQVTARGQSLPVQAVPEATSVVRPYAFRGRFNGTIRVPIEDGSNQVVVEAANTVGNRAGHAFTLNIRQSLDLHDPPPAGVYAAEKYLDPFTLLWHPLRDDAVDSLALYHHTGTPSDEDFVVETGTNTLVFTTTSPELGEATLTLTVPPAGNNAQAPDAPGGPAADNDAAIQSNATARTIGATVSSSALALFEEPFTFVETAAGSGRFKTIARRLPDNTLMRAALSAPPGTGTASSVAVTLDKSAAPASATLQALAPGSLTFSAPSGALGSSSLRVESIDGAANQPRTLNVFFTSATASLVDHYVALTETGVGTLQFATETRVVIAMPPPEPPTPTSTAIAGVVNEPEPPDAPAEPVWVVAKGLRQAQVGDVGLLDGADFELTTAAAPAASGSAPVPSVRFAVPVAFVRNPGATTARNIKQVAAPQQGFARTTVDATVHEAAMRFVNGPVIRRSFSGLALSKAVAVRGTQTKLVLSWVSDRPDLRIASITASGTGVSLSIKTNTSAPVTANTSKVTLNVTAMVAQDAVRGPRDLTVSFTNGQFKTFRKALTVSQGRAIVFAIDGMSRAIFDKQVSNPKTALHALFGAPAELKQAIVHTVATSFPPITFSRWATIFSGHTPKETLTPALQWFNRQALISGTDQYGAINQGLAEWDITVAMQAPYRASFLPGGGAYNRYFKVDFVYDKLRAEGFRSLVILQQAGLGKGNSQPKLDDQWLIAPRGMGLVAAPFAAAQLPLVEASARFADETATSLAESRLRNTGGDFDLMVVYLLGLDHVLHLEGITARDGHDVAEQYFQSFLDQRLWTVIAAADPLLESTVFGLYGDHGHYETSEIKSIQLDSQGTGIKAHATMLETLTASKKLRVGAEYRESMLGIVTLRRPNVIFAPQFGMANIYVANNAAAGASPPDWTHAPTLGDLEPIVNNIFDNYVAHHEWNDRPISDILVRVPGDAGNGFAGDRYMVVPRNYARYKWGCGPQRDRGCTLADQLVDPDKLLNVGSGFDDPSALPEEWRYHQPAERLADLISPNSGDIVLLANAYWAYQFGAPYRAQHGTLTRADARVPMAFGYLGMSGDDSDDNMLGPIRDLLKDLGDEVPACSGVSTQRECIEEKTLERFFIKPQGQQQ